MSSETSTETAAVSARAGDAEDPGLRPWQFFLLAGMLGATAAVIVATGQSPASIIFISVIIVAAGFVGLAVYRTLAPLASTERAEMPTMVAGRTRAGLEREKTLVLRSIKELEFDYAMKKIAPADYEELSTRLRARALRLMEQLDAGAGYREAIEKELQDRLGKAGVRPASTAAPPSTVTPPAVMAPDGARACVCGTENDPDAKFCKNCGSKLQGAA